LDQPLQKLEQAIEDTIAQAIPPRSKWRALVRFVAWGLLAVYFLFALAVLFTRYYALPRVGEYKGEIERYASRALGQRITVGAIEAGWQGLRPELLLADVTLYDRDGRAALRLPAVEATLSWTSVLVASPRFYSLVFDRPRLEIRRDEAGKFYVAGMQLRAETEDAGIAQWVLAQREIVIRDASLTWDDELRGAPQLALPAVNFVLRTGLLGHRFALRARPPSELASALDVRGDLNRGDLADWRSWTGRLFAELEYTDLVAWRPWVDYPLDLRSGKGGVRLWLDLEGKSSSEATVDVALSQVAMRVAKGLPLLELDYLQGRLGATQTEGKSFEISGRNVAFRTGAGVELSSTDFRVLWRPEDGQTPQKGEMEANALDLDRLARLAEFFPFPRAARERLAATDPRGSVRNLKVAWTGDVENPQHYNVRAGFSKLAARANKGIPGFAGLTGRIEASDTGGSIALGSAQVELELPGIFAESPVRLDSLAGQISWKIVPDRFDLGFNSLSVANRDIAGTFSGGYAVRQGGDSIDLTGRFSRVEGKAVYRYVPKLPEKVVQYLKSTIRKGGSKDVRLRLKGDLSKFPFEDGSSGLFQIVAKVTDADLDYAAGWPNATGISGDLIFEGRGMRVEASRAAIVGIQAGSVRANIPDLFHREPRLGLEIRAEDRTADFLRFIEQSPVTQALDRVTEGMQATGTGRLALRLEIPLLDPERFKVAGEYQIVNNELRVDADAPPFSQVNGRLEFTEAAISARGVTSQFLGGPTTISLATRADGAIAASAQGTASMSQIPRAWGEGPLRHVSGAAAWQGTLTLARGKSVTLRVQSQLVGVSSQLPPPLGKQALDPLPLTIERVIAAAPARGDTFDVSLGPAVNARVQRRHDGTQYILERGVIGLNEPAVLDEREGLVVSGSLDYADVDRWSALMETKEETGAAFSPRFDLRIAELDFGGRRLNDVALRAATKGRVTEANIVAKELAGEIKWFPEGLGRIEARLAHFSMPEATPGREEKAPARDLPALDIVADKLVLGGKDLGRLELVAVNKALDWSIERLVLTGPESTLKAEGRWESWALRPSVKITKVELEVRDIGKYLERVGYPGAMRQGTATLEGNLSWIGSPQSLDFATLSGKLVLDAQKGQFLRAEPGVARLLGVLSMQSWITLDFRDLARRGFAFDSVSCSADIANGILSTKDFRMEGPSAQVQMSGQVNLVSETQDLHARVQPTIGTSLASILVVAVNPVWGLTAFVVDKILKNPLGQAFAFEYSVTGTWTEPVPKRLKAEVRPAETSDPPQ
jgi:uncharacterized protein (TIGR02099 family)